MLCILLGQPEAGGPLIEAERANYTVFVFNCHCMCGSGRPNACLLSLTSATSGISGMWVDSGNDPWAGRYAHVRPSAC